jgi:hypothetical protein
LYLSIKEFYQTLLKKEELEDVVKEIDSIFILQRILWIRMREILTRFYSTKPDTLLASRVRP